MADFDDLWNYNDPAATEAAFEKVLSEEGAEMPDPKRAELMSQIARTMGLQRRFDEAHEVLDRATVFAGEEPVALARCFLERGRAYNSAGEAEKATSYFERALEKADQASPGLELDARQPDFYAVDALHMLAIAAPPEQQMHFHRQAIARAESSRHALTRNWLGSLYNNLGWTLHDAGKHEEALDIFRRALEFRQEQGKEGPIRIARWSVARCLRSLGRVEEAMKAQEALAAEGESDGYVEEELAECLLALGRAEEAKPHFAKAWEMLSGDTWLAANESERLARLQKLGAAIGAAASTPEP